MHTITTRKLTFSCERDRLAAIYQTVDGIVAEADRATPPSVLRSLQVDFEALRHDAANAELAQCVGAIAAKVHQLQAAFRDARGGFAHMALRRDLKLLARRLLELTPVAH